MSLPLEPIMDMWVIYRPEPGTKGRHSVRLHRIYRHLPEPIISNAFVGPLDSLRGLMRHYGLAHLMRDANDDPSIVEIWI